MPTITSPSNTIITPAAVIAEKGAQMIIEDFAGTQLDADQPFATFDGLWR